MVDVYQIIDNSAPCRRIICCRPPVSDNLPPIWRQRSQRLSSLHSVALCTADQQQRLSCVHCTEHFVALCTTQQKTEECTVRCTVHQLYSTSRTGPKMYFVKFLLMDTKNLRATYWSMSISRWCFSVLLRHLIHSDEECFDVHHRVQSHCNAAV